MTVAGNHLNNEIYQRKHVCISVMYRCMQYACKKERVPEEKKKK